MTNDSPYQSERERYFAHQKQTGQESYEIIDAESIKSRLLQQRATVLRLDGNTSQVSLYKQGTKKTKALTTDFAKYHDFLKIIIYCPTCQSFGTTRRMWPFPLKTLQDFPETYAELVGGLAFPDDTIFLHCSYCNLKLLPSVDDVEKLDARTEDEYEIESLADISKTRSKPILAGQSTRYNKKRDEKADIISKRKRLAMEKLSTDYEHQRSEGVPDQK